MNFAEQLRAETIEKFREAAHTLRQAAEMAQRVDWLVSGDDGEDSFMRRWEKEVRHSWQNAIGEARADNAAPIPPTTI